MSHPDIPGPPKPVEEISRAISQLEVANVTDTSELTSLIGDILWQISNFSRVYKINAEFALTNTIETFITKLETGEYDTRYAKEAKR